MGRNTALKIDEVDGMSFDLPEQSQPLLSEASQSTSDDSNPLEGTDRDYFKVSSAVLQSVKNSDIDIYVRKADNEYMKIKSRIEQWPGYDFYIRSSDIKGYVERIEKKSVDLLQNEKTPMGVKVDIIHESLNIGMTSLYRNWQLNEETLRITSTSVDHMVHYLSRDVKALSMLIKATKGDHHLCKHAISCAVLSIIMANASEMNSARSLFIVALGGLLHDIGLSVLPKAVLEKEFEDLSDEEKKQYRMHPLYGFHLLEKIETVPRDVRKIVLEHHEHVNGTGFPRQLKDAEIHPLAKIVSIADSFSDLTTRGWKKNVVAHPIEAINQLNQAEGVYDKHFLRLFTNLLLFPKNS